MIEQSYAIESGDEEATSWDGDFVLSMEYGMPPQSGWGMWVDRIISLLTSQENLRDVVLFPLMKDNDNESKNKETNLAVCVLNSYLKMEKWQELNTIAHLNAAYWARNGKWLFALNEVLTSDWDKISMNTSHAIIIKQTKNPLDILDLINKSKKDSLHIAEFTREMIETSDDKKIEEITKNKKLSEIDYLWVLVYWKKKDVERLTEKFELYE